MRHRQASRSASAGDWRVRLRELANHADSDRADDPTIEGLKRRFAEFEPTLPLQPREVLPFGLQQLPSSEGLWLEFGAGAGDTTRQIIDHAERRGKSDLVHSFDSFRGLPERWRPGFPKGAFSRGGVPPFYHDRLEWHIGLFSETLPAFLASLPRGSSISCMHIDCDLYSSTDQIFRHAEGLLAAGAIIVFDELLHYPGHEKHELLALRDMLQRTRRDFEIVWCDSRTYTQQVVIRLL